MVDYGKIMSAEEAVSHIKNGDRVMVGGFGQCGCPFALESALYDAGTKDLTIIANGVDIPGVGLGRLLSNGQIKALIGNYYNWNKEAIAAYSKGKIEVTLVPQGTFSEAIRAGGAGIPAFYTPTSAGTDLGYGKEVRYFDGVAHVLEYAIRADVAIIKAKKADRLGNLVYSKTTRSFNPLMAAAANYTIAEVEEIVEVGELDPENIITPHLYIDAIVEVRP